MKIITKDACYVQGVDIEHVIDNDLEFPIDIFFQANNGNQYIESPYDFIEIKGEKQMEYLKRCPYILDFAEYASRPKDDLKRLIKMIKKEMYDEIAASDTRSYDYVETKNTSEETKEKITREYILSQLIEMLEFKTGKSKLNFPNVPDPTHRVITDDKIVATLSLSPNKIIFKRVDGKEISLEEVDPVLYDFIVGELSQDMREYDESLEYKSDIEVDKDKNQIIHTITPINELEKKETSRKLIRV